MPDFFDFLLAQVQLHRPPTAALGVLFSRPLFTVTFVDTSLFAALN